MQSAARAASWRESGDFRGTFDTTRCGWPSTATSARGTSSSRRVSVQQASVSPPRTQRTLGGVSSFGTSSAPRLSVGEGCSSWLDSLLDSPRSKREPATEPPPPRAAEEPGERGVLLPLQVRRDIQALEEKLTRQTTRHQEQSEKLMEILLHPLEAQVAALERKQPALDARLAEIGGSIKGLQDTLELQVSRTDNAEARLRRFRHLLEDELQQKHAELKHALREMLSNVVTQSELSDATSAWKQELARSLEEVRSRAPTALDQPPPTDAVTRQELADAMRSLRDELDAVRKAAAPQQASSTDITSPDRTQRRSLSELWDRAAVGDRALEDLRREVGRLTEDVNAMKVLTRPEVELLIEQVSDSVFRSRMGGSPTGPRFDRGQCSSDEDLRAEVEAMHAKLQDLSEELAALSAETAAKVAELVGETTTNRQNNETMAVVMETASMRLEALEERQRCLRAEVAGADIEHRLEKTWQAVEEEGSRRAASVRQMGTLQRRVEALERASSGMPSPDRNLRCDRSEGEQTAPPSPLSANAARMADDLAADLRGQGLRHTGPPLGCEAVLKEALEDLRAEVSALWGAVSELADFTGVQCTNLAAHRSGAPSPRSSEAEGLEIRQPPALFRGATGEDLAELRESVNRLGARVSGCELDLNQLRRELGGCLADHQERAVPRDVPPRGENLHSFVRRTLTDAQLEDVEALPSDGPAATAGAGPAATPSTVDAGLGSQWPPEETPIQHEQTPLAPHRMSSAPTIRQADWSGELGTLPEITPAQDCGSTIAVTPGERLPQVFPMTSSAVAGVSDLGGSS